MKKISLVLTIVILFSACLSKKTKKIIEIKKQYSELVYPKDTIILGTVESISVKKVKRMGDLLYSNSNEVIINSDTTNDQTLMVYSVCVDTLTFNVGDTVSVYIKLKQLGKGFSDVTFINPLIWDSNEGMLSPKNRKSTITHWTVVNLNYQKMRNKKIKEIK